MAAYEYDQSLLWVIVAVAGFLVTFILAKMRVVTHANIVKFCTWVSAIVAAIIALNAESSSSSAVVGILGRFAVFALCWIIFGLIITLGANFGLDKASRPDK